MRVLPGGAPGNGEMGHVVYEGRNRLVRVSRVERLRVWLAGLMSSLAVHCDTFEGGRSRVVGPGLGLWSRLTGRSRIG